MRKLSQQFEGRLTNSIEGLKIKLDEHDWVLILPSQDQPNISIVVEASSQANANRLVKEYAQLVEDLQPQTL